ncbi:ATP-binding protein [Maritalea sp.]|uniref:sensor histidine kinase n=1 Tax=Maritalea sp. TaxID=2003361 RepID=UPI003EF8A06F
MKPGTFPIGGGVAGFLSAPIALMLTSPTFAQANTLTSNQLLSTTPYAIAVGAVLFGAATTFVALTQRHQSQRAAQRAQAQLIELSAELDEKENILNGMAEVTVIWRDPSEMPHVVGQVRQVVENYISDEAILSFDDWLTPQSAIEVKFKLADLLAQGTEFEFGVSGTTGMRYRICGKLVAGSPVLRIARRIAEEEVPYTLPSSGNSVQDIESCAQIFENLNHPAWVRDVRGKLVKVNEAYYRLLGIKEDDREGDIPELFDAIALTRLREIELTNGPGSIIQKHQKFGTMDITKFKLADGTAGYAVQGLASNEEKNDPRLSFLTAAINELRTPVAVFDGSAQLTHYNKSFAQFWELDIVWLDTHPNEKAILDRLRTQGQLPLEPDYKKWRSTHLSSYGLKKTREDMWHLPSGQVLNVIASPAPNARGVIYVYHNVTEKLALESRYNALIHVQDETLNALREAVAVFGTDGRLKLHNTQLSGMWKLPLNELSKQTHIADIVDLCEATLAQDGRDIWLDLKSHIVDISAERSNKSGRIRRLDGRLIDYAIVRLPDGQTLLTFVDITEGAAYEKVLKERNEALETADKLKDAFVQNVSYEFRSPLTNIIGFADLLSSGEAGELNEKQLSYASYIRASSATLGLLIDNILDLTTIDAGIAELNTEVLDIEKLIDQAKAGVVATLQVAQSDVPINLDINIAPNLPTFVADGARIVQVLYNLLSNAVRFSEPGSKVSLDVTERAGRMLFIVEDEGEGIPEELISSIFDRFEGQAVAGKQRGAGLGLSIVKTFAHMHGGTVDIERREPKGTRVVVNLPVEQLSRGVAE